MLKSAALATRKLAASRAINSVYERLEQRQMMSVSHDVNGATIVTPGAGDHVIYCSSSTGNDKNNGLSPQSPVQSIAQAESLLRNHTGDELLFKAGDVWNTGFGYWSLSGASAQDPMVIGSYGSGARPEFLTGTDSGFTTGRSSAKEVDYLDIMGLNFDASGRDPTLTHTPATNTNPTGINILSISNDLLIENCQTQYYDVNINVEKYWGEIQNVDIRRNVIDNSWSTTQHSQGMYALGVDNLTLDGNFFDHNGYNEQISGAVATFYNHDCYLNSTNTNCVVENNVFSRAAGYGLQDRPGGIVKNNVFIDDPVGMSFGLVNGASTTAGGVSGLVTGNVFIGGGNIGTMQGGQALVVGNIKPGSGTVISHNIFADSVAKAPPAIALDYGIGQSNSQASVGINDLTIDSNIIFNWTTGIDVMNGMTPGGKGLTALNNVTITNNQFENLSAAPINNHDASYTAQEHFSGNTYYNTGQSISAWQYVLPVGQTAGNPLAFADPARSIASYDALAGGSGTVSAFLAGAAKQNEQAWNPVYDATSVINYIDAGFSIASPVVTPPPVVAPAPVVTPPAAKPPVVTPPATKPPVVSTAPVVTSPRSAKSTFKALNYTAQSGGMKFDNINGLGYINGGDWVGYDKIDFGAGVKTFSVKIAGKYAGGTIELHTHSPDGPVIGTLKIKPTGAWGNYTTETTKITGASGVHELFLVFKGGTGVCNISTFTFL